MKLELLNQSEVRMPKKFIHEWCGRVRTLLSEELSAKVAANLKQELVIVFMDSKPAQKLNREYRKRNYATDILSFHSDSGLGELVLCPQVLKEQAAQNGHGFQEELGYLLLHGVLHLLGFDHEKSHDQEILMFQLQDRIFEKLRKDFF